MGYGRWKTTFGGRQPSMEDDLWWKMTFGERRPLVEDKLRLKTTFGGRQPLVEDNLCWKITFGGRRQPLVIGNPRWNFGGRQPLVEEDLPWKTTFGGDSSPWQSQPNWVQTIISISCLNRTCHYRQMYAALCMHMGAKKSFRQRRLKHYNIGVGRGEG